MHEADTPDSDKWGVSDTNPSGQIAHLSERTTRNWPMRLAVLTGLEPATSALTGRRALQLLHRTSCNDCRAPNGIRTRATALKGRRPGPLDDGGPVGDRASLATLCA